MATCHTCMARTQVWQEPFGILEAEPREQRIEGRWHIVELVKTMLYLDSEFYGCVALRLATTLLI